jgi:DNA-directed RNA polymerase subunit RPC12/RpoP
MESFRLVCRDGRGEWYMHEADAESALAAFEHSVASGRSPHVVVPVRLGRGVENSIVQRWKQGAVELGDCLNCGYELKGLVRAADGFAQCPECGVGVVMKPLPVEPPPFSPLSAPNFKPGAVLESWGLTFSLIGLIFFPLAILGILLGAFAYEYSRGARGTWAMRLGTAAVVIGLLIFFARGLF